MGLVRVTRPSHAVLLWAIFAATIGGVLLGIFLPVHFDGKLRDMSDPMVSSHLFAAIPVVTALYLQMPATALIITAATLTSFFYHLNREEKGPAILAYGDVALANYMLVWVLLILATSATLVPDKQLLAMTSLTGLLAIVVFFMPRWLINDDMSEADAIHACKRMRLHPLWHLLGFVGISFVLFNFDRSALSDKVFAPRGSLLRSLQTFHW